MPAIGFDRVIDVTNAKSNYTIRQIYFYENSKHAHVDDSLTIATHDSFK